jgi:hypothetical protein
MKVEINGNQCVITKEAGDPKFYGMSGESLLLYKIKQELIKQGYDVIKKRIQKDGHMIGDEEMQYIRTRNWKAKDFMMIYDGDYVFRAMTGDFNKGELILNIERGE